MKEYEYNGKAMGTTYYISIICNSEIIAQKLSNEAIKEIEHNENIFSRFKENSELSILNKEKEKKVSNEFIEIILEAHRLFVLTKGIFNPLVQIERFGYDKNFDEILENKNKLNTEKYDINFDSVIIDKINSKIILQKNQKLDFGGFLKGYLAENICKKIKRYSKDIQGVIINIGGDIHTQGFDENNNKFVFNIFNPTKSEEINVTLYNQSLATSGTYKRNWKNSNSIFHHILDSSGIKNPDNDTISSSVICEKGGESEAYSKVLLSSNSEDKISEITKEGIKFIIIKKDGSIIKNIE